MKTVGFWIRIALLVLCAAVFLVSAGMLVKILIGYEDADKTYESINEGFEALTGETDGESETETETDGASVPPEPHVTYRTDMTEQMKEQYAYLMNLKEQYPDVVGYISVPSVSINYPVVQTDNNDYYLDHLITGEVSSSGSVFLDYRCDADALTAKNSILYGHNMNNGGMFHNIELLFELDTFLGTTVEYICEQGIFLYKPLSVYRADATYPFAKYAFADDEAYLTFCRTAVEKSRFVESEDVTYGADSSIITLITCTNSITSKTGRYVFQAVLDTVYLAETVEE